MRISRLLAIGAAGTAAVLGITTAALAAPSTHSSRSVASHSAARDVLRAPAAPDSLRALASRVGLHVGVAIIPQDLNTPANAAIAAAQFSSVTPENDMKWGVVEPVQGVFNWSGADNDVSFAEQNGQLVRGFTLLSHNLLPNWLTQGVGNGSITDTQLSDLLHQWITAEVSRYKGKIWQWDVASEFFTDSNPSQINPNDFWIHNLGAGVIADAFQWAHEADPRAQLCYNDYNIAGEDGSNAKSDAVYAWLKQELAAGVPINCVGDEGHLDTQFGFSGTLMTQDLQRYASLGLKVGITQADVRTFVDGPTTQNPTDHLAQFAQPYLFSQMLKACLAVRQCLSFTVWGVYDGDSWVPGTFKGEGYATLYDVNLNPKPAYTDLQQDLELAAHGAPHRSAFGPGFGFGF
jgi:endo-1,4-beta-xylanase